MSQIKIIVPFYNVEKWIKKCVKSIILQNVQDYECYFIDDMSTDKTVNIIEEMTEKDSRFKVIKNTEKKYALQNIYEAIRNSGNDPEDIIVTLDGDDFFATKNVLTKLTQVYNDYKCLMTYGSYIEYPSMQKGTFCRQIPESIIKNNHYRESSWLSSHLRTFKRTLWNEIDVSDLKDDNGKFYRMTWDMAFMFPMLEMAGPLAIHIPDILYVYNRENPINDDKVNHRLQIDTEQTIRNKKKYIQNFVSCDILGPGSANSGLGNQLFCVANALSYAKDNNKKAFFPQILSNKDISKYKEAFYSNLHIGLDISIHDILYSEPEFSYSRIPDFSGNVKLSGYFQSEKYFSHNREYILESLNIKTLQKETVLKYGDFSDCISIHIRRGDYLKLKDYHGVLGIDYYKNAVKYFGADQKYIVFSDDIEWCRNNLNFVDDVIYFSCEKDWEDMILMSTCKAHIIANSSFSWWSAWISGNQAVAPKKWFTKNINTSDIKLKKWKEY